MQFEKCLTCSSIKEGLCSGPKFMRAPTKDLVEWMVTYQKLHGITNAQWAAKSGVPKGTIDGLKNRADVRHETVYPLLKALIEMSGGIWDGESCPLVVGGSSTAEQQQEISRLTQELEHTKDLLKRSYREVKDRTIWAASMFALSVGVVFLLLIVNL